jgi:hypothetical protein
MPAGATYEPLATTTLGTAAASITFSSISSSYTDLRVIWTASAAGSEFPTLRFNGDTGTNYSSTRLYGNGTSAASARSSTQTEIAIASDIAMPTSSSTFCLITIDIFSYAGSTNKTCLSVYSNDRNGSGEVARNVGLWRTTSAINSITLKTRDGTNMAIGTTATLYGIARA